MAQRGMRWLPSATFAFILVSVVYTSPSLAAHAGAVGVVEGYYWDAGDAVNGQSGVLSPAQRCQAIRAASAAGLDFYLFAPHTGSDTSLSLLPPASAEAWKGAAAIAHAHTVTLVFGVRPGFVDASTPSAVSAKLSQLAALGVRSYALLFDDTPGANTTGQRDAQALLLQSLGAPGASSGLVLWGLVPASYYGDPAVQRNWLGSLVAALPASAAVVLTGTAVTPSTVALADFPAFAAPRRIVFWDNWAATDSGARIAWSLGRGTPLPTELYTSGSYGYVANIPFPLERAVHHIARAGQLAAAGRAGVAAASRTDSGAVDAAATQWSEFLAMSGFAWNMTAAGMAALKSTLASLIVRDDAFSSMDALADAWPAVRGVFVCNCTAGCPNTRFCGTGAASPYDETCACTANALNPFGAPVCVTESLPYVPYNAAARPPLERAWVLALGGLAAAVAFAG